jgi:hypothetical protein
MTGRRSVPLLIAGFWPSWRCSSGTRRTSGQSFVGSAISLGGTPNATMAGHLGMALRGVIQAADGTADFDRSGAYVGGADIHTLAVQVVNERRTVSGRRRCRGQHAEANNCDRERSGYQLESCPLHPYPLVLESRVVIGVVLSPRD